MSERSSAAECRSHSTRRPPPPNDPPARASSIGRPDVSSFGSILSIARTAIAAQQTAIQVISQNVANAETEGYSRQRAELVARTPQRFGFGSVGTGVEVQNV